MITNFQSQEAIKEQIDGEHRYFLAYYDKEAVGYFAVVPEPETDSLFLSKFYIDKDFRGRG